MRRAAARARIAGMPARALLVCLAALVLGALAPRTAAALPRPPQVVVDTDMDFDDAAALAYLGEADRLGMIDLRAVTVSVAGVGIPGNGLAHARCELRNVGLPFVPVTDGDRAGLHAFPAFALPLIDGLVDRAVAPCAAARTQGLAAELLAASILLAPGKVTLITLGPLTDVAEALRRYPLIGVKLDHVVAEGGGTTDEGPQDGTKNFNFYADAPSAQAVLRALPGRVVLVGGNATDHVPLTAAFRLRLAADRTTPAANAVYSIASDPLTMASEQGGPVGGGFWWDPLAAVAATVDGVVAFAPARMSVVQSGANEGATVLDPHGVPVSLGVSADQGRFEDTFIDVLNGRRPRARR
jgi:purine nucleosidase